MERLWFDREKYLQAFDRCITGRLNLVIIKGWIPVRGRVLSRMKDIDLIVRHFEIKDISIFLDTRRGR